MPVAEGEGRPAPTPTAGASPLEAALLAGLGRLHEAVSTAGGTAGVLGVAVASPLAFATLPWLLAVLAVFLVGIAVELGPGLLVEALAKRIEAAAKKKAGESEQPPSASSARAAGAAGAAPPAAAGAASFRQRRGTRPQPLDAQQEGEEDSSPTAAGGATGNGSQGATPTAAARTPGGSLVPRPAVARRDVSLRGARADVREWRVVEGSFASYKVVVTCGKGVGSGWTVWRRFSDFEALREALIAARSGGNNSPHGSGGNDGGNGGSSSSSSSSLPQLPAKTLFKNLSPKFLTKRAAALQAFLRDLLARPTLCDDPTLRAFLDATPLVVAQAAAASQQQHQQQHQQPGLGSIPPPPRLSPAVSEEGSLPPSLDPPASGADMEGRAAPAMEAKEDGDRLQQPQGQPLHHASQPGAAQRCGGMPQELALAEVEPREEGEPLDRPALSTASTDDGVEDEERAREAARSILETMRELSARSPNDWPAPEEGAGAAGGSAGAGAVERAAAAAAVGAGVALPASCRGMSLQAYQTLSLRLQHPTAYYDPGPTNSFRIRGRRYMLDGHKVPAGPAVGTLVLAMVFTVPPHYPGGREDHIASRGRMKERLAALRELDARDGRPPFSFVLNFQVPGDPPLSLVCVFALPRDRRPEDGHFWPLFDRFVDFGPAHSEASSSAAGTPAPAPSVVSPSGVFPLEDVRNKRFKLIPAIVDGPSMIKWAVGNKPTILGQKLTQRYFRGEDYVELDVDIASSAVASQIVSLCRGYARHLKVQMAIVLQGEGEAELPEKLIGCVGIDNLDINHAADGPNVLGEKGSG